VPRNLSVAENARRSGELKSEGSQSSVLYPSTVLMVTSCEMEEVADEQ
jgi:hypothetical protein